VTQDTIDKAAKIAHEGRVRPAGAASVYRVSGDSAIYRVVVAEDFAWCECPARGLCSHAAAAMLIHDEDVDRVAA
jgi:hypothetical protein